MNKHLVILALVLLQGSVARALFPPTPTPTSTATATPSATPTPAGIIVTSLADNTTPGDGLVTLREAIANANCDCDTTGGDAPAGSGADVIDLSGLSGTINLNMAVGCGSQIPITGPLTIRGPGVGALTIRSSNALLCGLFRVAPGVGPVRFENLRFANTVVGISGTSPPGGFLRGGIIDNDGTLEVESCEFSDVGVDGNDFESVVFPVWQGVPARGGAIYNAGSLTVLRTTFRRAVALGGQGFSSYGAGGTCTTWGFPGDPGKEGAGGAIYNAATASFLHVEDSLFDTCGASGGRGGPGCHGGTEGGSGGTGGYGRGGAIYDGSGAASGVTIINSTLSGNSASGGGGGNGGFAQIDAGRGGDGGHGQGGALWLEGNGGVLRHLTVASNQCMRGGPGFGGYSDVNGYAPDGSPGTARAGGIWTFGYDPEIEACIVALNTVQGGGGAASPDLEMFFSSQGNNIIGILGAASGFGAPGDLLGSSGSPIDPLLAPLADNGGPTFTRALQPGSPAINHISGIDCIEPTDQRGIPRPQEGACDVGAFESGYTFPPTATPSATGTPSPTTTPSPTVTPSPDPTISPTVTVSPTVTPSPNPSPSPGPSVTPTSSPAPTPTASPVCDIPDALKHTLGSPMPGANDYFGSPVSLDGRLALVGEPFDDTGAFDSGRVFLFDAIDGSLIRTINNPEPAAGDYFGFALFLDGGLALVGTRYDSFGGLRSGSAYLFAAETGTLLQTFRNPTPAVDDWFGVQVAVCPSYSLIAATLDDTGAMNAGSAYLFDNAAGTLIHTLNNPDPADGDTMGSSVAVSGQYAVVGCDDNRVAGVQAGSVYVFDCLTGLLVRTIDNPSPGTLDYFGNSVSLSGTTLLVGAQKDDGSVPDGGRAFLYDVETGAIIRTFESPSPVSNEYFGCSVSLDQGMALVGAQLNDFGANNAGAAYLFDAMTGGHVRTFYNPTPADSDQFAARLSLSGSRALIACNSDDTFASNAGAAYVFGPPNACPTPTPNATASPDPTRTPTPSPPPTPTPSPVPCCPGDADNSGGAVNAQDFLAVQAAFAMDNGTGGLGDADCSGGAVNAQDFLAVQANFGLNCG